MEERIMGLCDMTNEEYHASEGISRTGLWLYKSNPYKYWYQYLSGTYERPAPSPQMILGSLAHTAILEPSHIDLRYAVKPELEKLPKAVLLKDVGRQEYDLNKEEIEYTRKRNARAMDKFEHESQGKEVIDKELLDTALAIKEAIFSREMCSQLLQGAKIEQSIYWTDPETEMLCKIRPDAFTDSIGIDLKTTKDASYRSFQSSCANMGYFLQAGMIHEGLKSVGIKMKKFVFIAVETLKPHALGVYILDDEALQYGIDLFHALLRKYVVSRETNEFNDYGLQMLLAPKYAIDELNQG